MRNAQLLLGVLLIQVSYLCGATKDELSAAVHHWTRAEMDALQLESHADLRCRSTFNRLEVLHVSRVNLNSITREKEAVQYRFEFPPFERVIFVERSIAYIANERRGKVNKLIHIKFNFHVF